MTYCAIDFGKREYNFNVSGISNRNSSKILGSFVYLARKFPNLVWDRFGIIDDNISRNSLPRYTNMSLLDGSYKRIKELGVADIAWSGGIDSSFVAAVYKGSGIPFRILYNNESLKSKAGQLLFKLFRKNDIECICISNLKDYSLYPKVITGDGADILFAPSKGDLFIDSPILMRGIRLSIYESLKYAYSLEADNLYEQIRFYGSKLGKPIDNDIDISRLMQWGCLYYFKRDYFRVITGSDIDKMIPFFDTNYFFDISYSSFWESRYENGCKQFQRKYISKIFGDKSLYSILSRNPSPYLRPINAIDYHRF